MPSGLSLVRVVAVFPRSDCAPVFTVQACALIAFRTTNPKKPAMSAVTNTIVQGETDGPLLPDGLKRKTAPRANDMMPPTVKKP